MLTFFLSLLIALWSSVCILKQSEIAVFILSIAGTPWSIVLWATLTLAVLLITILPAIKMFSLIDSAIEESRRDYYVLAWLSWESEALVRKIDELGSFVGFSNSFHALNDLREISRTLAKYDQDKQHTDRAYGAFAHVFFVNPNFSENSTKSEQFLYKKYREEALSYIERISNPENLSSTQALKIAEHYLFSHPETTQKEINGLIFLYAAARFERDEGQTARTLLLDR